MPFQIGSDRSFASSSIGGIYTDAGATMLQTSTLFGANPLSGAALAQILFAVPNGTFDQLPSNMNTRIDDNDNPLPYWTVNDNSDSRMQVSVVYDSASKTSSLRFTPGSAVTDDYLTATTRSYVINDDNLGLRQKLIMTMAKSAAYAGANQFNISVTVSYYDHTDTLLTSRTVGSVNDNATFTGISGFTTTGSTAVSASASYCDIAITMSATANVTSGLSVDVDSVLIASKIGASGSFMTVDRFTSSGTWTRPAGVEYVTLVGIGAGGGGGGGGYSGNYTVDRSGSGGLAGASSSWAIIRDLYVGGAGDATVTVGVGAGGAAGLGSSVTKAATVTTTYQVDRTAAGNGGSTTFSTYLVIGGGGGAGLTGTAAGGATPTSTMYGLEYLASVSAGAPNGPVGNVSPYGQLPFWGAFAAGTAGGNGTATTTAGAQTLLAGTGGAAGAAGLIGGGGRGGAASVSAPSPINYTITAPGSGGNGAGGGGAGALVRWNATATVVATGANAGQTAANSGAGGSGGGGALTYASSSTVWNASTVTMTGGNGAAGGDGLLLIIYTA